MRLLWVVLCSTLVGSGARKPDYPTTAKVAKFNPPPPPNNPMLHIVDPKLARRQDEPNNVVRAGLQVRSLGAATNTASPHWCVPFKTLLAHPWGLGSLWGRTARRQREARWVQHGQLV